MPIIINGASRRAGGWWAKHLTNKETNERVELVDIRGLAAETVRDAFREMQALAIGTKCANYFYQANINPRADEHLTSEQWAEAVDTLEQNLGFSGQPRFVVEHEKGGRTHQHVVWSRIDIEHQRALPDSLTAPIHEQTSRELEIAFGLEPGKSILVPDRDFARPERGPEKWERFRGDRHGIDPEDIASELTELWQASDNGQSFKTAIEERGYVLAAGDRRDFVVLDEAGDVHSLARRLDGVRAKDVRERMADIDRAELPTVDEAKALIDERNHATSYYDRDAADAAWQAQVTDAAIAADSRDARRAAFLDDLAQARPATAIEERINELATSVPNGEEFLRLLGADGLTLARASRDDLDYLRTELSTSFAESDKLLSPSALAITEGELVAVNRFGGIHRLNLHKIDSDLCEALVTDGGGTLDSIETVRGDALDVRASQSEHWQEVRDDIAASREERAREIDDTSDMASPPSDDGAPDVTRGFGKLLDMVAKPVEHFINFLDGMVAPSKQRPVVATPREQEAPSLPTEIPSPDLVMSDSARQRAVARALSEIDSAARQEQELQPPDRERERERDQERWVGSS